MADTLITSLSNLRPLIIRPTSAVRRYGGLDQDPVAAGRELKVDAVMDGSIQRLGDRIRVTVRLIRVRDGSSLWAKQFDEGASDIFAVQAIWADAIRNARPRAKAGDIFNMAAGVEFRRPDDIAEAVADVLADNGVVAWFQGRSEFGPRALGHRSLLADPRRPENLEKLNDIKGREQFRPVAPMVLAERAPEIFAGGPLPSPYMLFTHSVAREWQERIPAVVHVDGTARVQTVERAEEPLVARMLDAFEARTGVPVVVNTSLNTAGRPMVDSPRDALECFGSAPVDALAIGPYLLERAGVRA